MQSYRSFLIGEDCSLYMLLWNSLTRVLIISTEHVIMNINRCASTDTLQVNHQNVPHPKWTRIKKFTRKYAVSLQIFMFRQKKSYVGKINYVRYLLPNLK